MLYCYQRPTGGVTFSVAGTGASIASDSRLDNGQPSETTAIAWLSEASPTTADYIDLRASWASALPVRVVSMLGLSCGAGVRVVVTGRRSGDAGYTYALGGNSTTQDTVAQADGRVDHIMVGDAGLDSLIGVQWRIYNDRNSSTWATATTDLLIGEADTWSAVEMCGRIGWARPRRDPSEHMDLLSGGEHTWVKTSWRTPEVDLSPTDVEYVRGNALANGTDWETIEALAVGNARALLVLDPDNERDRFRTAFFGRPSWDAITQSQQSQRLYSSRLRMREVV